MQDTIVVVPPYPYSIADDTDNVPFGDCWYAHPQLFFKYYLHPAGGRSPKNPSYKIGPDYLLFNLVFFSTFEELNHLESYPPGINMYIHVYTMYIRAIYNAIVFTMLKHVCTYHEMYIPVCTWYVLHRGGARQLGKRQDIAAGPMAAGKSHAKKNAVHRRAEAVQPS